MEYYTNPKETYSQTVLPYPKDTDPIVKSLHQGEHVLFWDPGIHKNRIKYNRTVQEQCDWLNSADIWQDPFRVATIVKLNIYIDDIKRQGVVKPMLLYYDGNEKFGVHTGENRMRATELIPDLVMLESFITTHKQFANLFSHLPQIENFEQFQEICRTPIGCKYTFTFTDQDAPYGIFWFEYDSDQTRAVTPGYDWCERVMRNYLKKNKINFTPAWFDSLVDWKSYE